MNRLCFCVLVLAFLAVPGARTLSQEWLVPTVMKKLNNGLVVVVSEEHSAPTFGLCIAYGIGFRLEPEGRTGFAHLFEHNFYGDFKDLDAATIQDVESFYQHYYAPNN